MKPLTGPDLGHACRFSDEPVRDQGDPLVLRLSTRSVARRLPRVDRSGQRSPATSRSGSSGRPVRRARPFRVRSQPTSAGWLGPRYLASPGAVVARALPPAGWTWSGVCASDARRSITPRRCQQRPWRPHLAGSRGLLNGLINRGPAVGNGPGRIDLAACLGQLGVAPGGPDPGPDGGLLVLDAAIEGDR
jgi:hypothetical protein